MKYFTIVIFLLGNICMMFSNNAINLGGIDDKIVVAENDSEFPSLFTDLDNNSFTLSFWIYPQDNDSQASRIIDITHNSSEFFVMIYYNDHLSMKVKAPGKGSKLIGSDNSITENQWYHCQIEWDCSIPELIFILDNIEQFNDIQDMSCGSSDHFYLGAKTDNSLNFNGKIDEFTIWDDANLNWQVREVYPDRVTGNEEHLYLHYGMDEFYQSTYMEDISGNDFHGECFGFEESDLEEMDVWQNGFKCLALDGADDYLRVSNCEDLNSDTYTYILWFNTDDMTSDQYIFSKGDNGYYLKLGVDQQFDFNGYTSSASSVETDKWYNVAVAKSSSEHKLYLNGKELELSGAGNYYTNSDPLYFGRRNFNLFSGKIDEIQLYNTALSEGEISDLIYSNFLEHANLIGWFDCNQLDGNIVYDQMSNLHATLAGVDSGTITQSNLFAIIDNTQNWIEGQHIGNYISIEHSGFLQDRLITERYSNTNLKIDESLGIYPDVGSPYYISDAQSADSDLIYPEGLPPGYNSSGYTIWQNHPEAYSSGLTIKSTGISSGDYLQGACNGQEGISDEDIDGQLDYRLAAVWYLESHGDITDLTLEFDVCRICGSGIILGNESNYKLLYRTGSRDMFSIVSDNIMVDLLNSTTLSFSGSTLNSPQGYYTIGAINNVPLPVTLTSFTGIWTDGSCCLKWQTASETNNCGWNIFRSEGEGNSFKINASLIPGTGTSTASMSYSYTDEYETIPGVNYYYWLESLSLLGAAQQFGPISIFVPENDNQDSPPLLERFGITCQPNPCNPTTIICYNVSQTGYYNLKVYNAKGQLVKTLFEFQHLIEREEQYLVWNGKNSQNKTVASGSYLLHLYGEAEQYYYKFSLLK